MIPSTRVRWTLALALNSVFSTMFNDLLSRKTVKKTNFFNMNQVFNELQKLTQQRDDLDIEWGQLQLEQSTWATNGRVETVARDDLHMVIPQATDLRIVVAALRISASLERMGDLAACSQRLQCNLADFPFQIAASLQQQRQHAQRQSAAYPGLQPRHPRRRGGSRARRPRGSAPAARSRAPTRAR